MTFTCKTCGKTFDKQFKLDWRGGTIAEAIDASRRRGEGMLVLESKKELPDAV